MQPSSEPARRALPRPGGSRARAGESSCWRPVAVPVDAVTDQSLGVPADLGAAWLHFARDNPWTALADAGGFTVLRREPNWGAAAWIGDRPPTPEEEPQPVLPTCDTRALIEAAATAGRDVALTEVLPQDDYRARFDAVMTWAVGAESRDVSTLDLQRYAESRTTTGRCTRGWAPWLPRAARDLPDLTSARRSMPSTGAAMACASSARSGRIEADAVIVTVPTSVLAQRRDPLHASAACHVRGGLRQPAAGHREQGVLPHRTRPLHGRQRGTSSARSPARAPAPGWCQCGRPAAADGLLRRGPVTRAGTARRPCALRAR